MRKNNRKNIIAIIVSAVIVWSAVFCVPTFGRADTSRTTIENGTFDTNVDGWTQIDSSYGDIAFDNGRLKYTARHLDRGNTNGTSYVYQEVKLAPGEYTWSFDVEKSSYGLYQYFGVYDSKNNIGKSGLRYESGSVYYSQSAKANINTSLLNKWVDIPTAATDELNKTITANTYFKNGGNEYCCTYTDHQANTGTSIIKVTYNFILSNEETVYFATGNECRANSTDDYYFYLDNVTLNRTRTTIENGTFDTNVDGWTQINSSYGDIAFDNGRLKYTAKHLDRGNTNGTSYVYQEVKLEPGEYTWSFDVEKSSYGLYQYFGVYANKETIGKSGLIYDSASVYYSKSASPSINASLLNKWIDVPSTSSSTLNSSITANTYFKNGGNEYCCTYTNHQANESTSAIKVSYKFTIENATTVYFATGNECRANDTEDYYFYLDNVLLNRTRTTIENGTFDSSVDEWSPISNSYGDMVWDNGRLKYIAKKLDRGNTSGTSYVYQEVKLVPGEYTWTFDVEKSSYGLYQYFGVYSSKDTIGKSGMIYKSASVYYSQSASSSIDTSLLNKWSEVPSVSSSTLNSTITANTYFKNSGNEYCCTYTNHQANSSTSIIKVSYKFQIDQETTVYFATGNECRANDTEDYYFYLDNVELAVNEYIYSGRTELENGTFDSNVNGWLPISKDYGDVTWENGRLKYTGKHLDRGNSNGTSYVYQDVKLAPGAYTWTFDVEKSSYGLYEYFGVYSSKDTIGKSGMIYDSARVYYSQSASPSINTSLLNKWIEVPQQSSSTLNASITETTYFKNNSNEYCCTYTNHQANTATSIIQVNYRFILESETTVYFAIGNDCRADNTNDYYFYLDNVVLKTGISDDSTTRTELENGSFDSGVDAWESTDNVTGVISYDSDNKRLMFTQTANESYVYQAVHLEPGTYGWSFSAQKGNYGNFVKFGVYTSRESIGIKGLVKADKNSRANYNKTYDISSLTPVSVLPTNEGVCKFGEAYFNIRTGQDENESRKFDVKVVYNFTLNEAKTVYLAVSASVHRTYTSYLFLDNVKLGSPVNGPDIDYSFETGDLSELIYGSNTEYSLSQTTELVPGLGYNSNYALKSVAVSDKENGTINNSPLYQAGWLSIPLTTNINRFYRTSFWIRIDGNNTTDSIGFRVSNEAGKALPGCSLVSTQKEINYSANLSTSTGERLDLVKIPGTGWAGYICVSNTTKGKWIQVSVEYASGENDQIYLDFINFARKGTVFYLDDILTTEIDGLREKPIITYSDPDIVYEVDFEDELEIPHSSAAINHYTRSKGKAHSGNYAVKWDADHDDGWGFLTFDDAAGDSTYGIELQPNTAYRFTIWVLKTGKGASRAKFAYQKPGLATTNVSLENDVWTKITIDFATGAATTDNDTTVYNLRIAAGISNSPETFMYFDDAKLEVLHSSVLEDVSPDSYCEEYFNKIENGNMEYPLKGTIWDYENIKIEKVASTSESSFQVGDYYARLSGTAALKVPIKVRKNYVYTFIYSYKATKSNDMKIGILDGEGNLLPPSKGTELETNSLLTPSISDGKWHRQGYKFLSPANGQIFFTITGSNLDICIDEIECFMSYIAYDEDPNGYAQPKPTDEEKYYDDTENANSDNNFYEEDFYVDEIDFGEDEFEDDAFEGDVFDTEDFETDEVQDINSSKEKSSKKAKSKSSSQMEDNNPLAIVIAVSVAAVIIAVVVILLIILRKKGVFKK